MKKQQQKEVSSPWTYKGEVVTPESIPEGSVGFVYRITTYNTLHDIQWSKDLVIPAENKKVYIGKKQLTSTRKSKIGVRAQKKQLEETGDKRRIKKVQRITKNSNWLCYDSSCIPLQNAIKEHPELVTKEILTWCHSKKHMSYEETRQQFLHQSLEIDSWNDHIQNWYRRDLQRPIPKTDTE